MTSDRKLKASRGDSKPEHFAVFPLSSEALTGQLADVLGRNLHPAHSIALLSREEMTERDLTTVPRS